MDIDKELTSLGIVFTQDRDDYVISCPFHDETEPSARISISTGMFHCFGCEEKGSIYKVLAKITGCTETAYKEFIDFDTNKAAVIAQNKVIKFQTDLSLNLEMRRILFTRKGLDIDAIKKYELGLEKNRITIPIYDNDSNVINIRKWSPSAKKKAYKVIGEKGCSPALFPIEQLKNDELIITEGEFKAILLIEHGFSAITSTGGANHWIDEWSPLFKDKIINIIFDIDAPGKLGATNIAFKLFPIAKQIKVIALNLPAQTTPKAGVDDFFILYKKTTDDLKQLIEDTAIWEPAATSDPEALDNTLHNCSLKESAQARFFQKRIKTNVLVAGKESSPYLVDRKLQISCTKDKWYCSGCPMLGLDTMEVEIASSNQALLEFVGKPNSQLHAARKKVCRIPHNCTICQFKTIASYNIEELLLVPQIQQDARTVEQIERRAYFVGEGTPTNASYILEGRVVPEPRTQQATILIDKMEPEKDSISSFKLTDEVKDKLTIFQTTNIQKKLDEIYKDFESNVTQIYGRRNLHLAIDLAFHSVLDIPFQGKLQKGWTEILLLGDSGQGKTEATQQLLDHYGLGEKVDSKMLSVAGLLGGVTETQNKRFLRWGKFVLNHGRLLFLDELKGMLTEIIDKLVDSRTRGIVQIEKIVGGKAMAKTRLLWASNPRSERPLSYYNYGIDAIKELFGALENIRRLDYAILLGSGDIKEEELNKIRLKGDRVKHRFTSKLCSSLVLWCWSRTADQVKVSRETEEAILKYSILQSKKFSSKVPLVEPSDHRLKLLRLSTALAGRVFSTVDGIDLIVKPEHVEFIYNLLDTTYSSPIFGYDDFSKAIEFENTLREPEVVKELLVGLNNRRSVVEGFLAAILFSTEDIMDWTGFDRPESKTLVGELARHRAIRKVTHGNYVKNPPFTNLIKEIASNGALQNSSAEDGEY